ncbi:MAG TPA: PAS domain-containing protein [Candidatus Binatia bacterium]|nr:PAS domain-containing protein [Candidatus Binatia bacterium]
MNTIPSHDTALRRVVERVTREAAPETAAELATRLRPLFPRVAVFERQLSGEGTQFYVYRDGRYEPERPEAWWSDPATPCVHVSTSDGRLTAVSGEFATLMRAEVDGLIGRHFLDLVLPDARVPAQAILEAVRDEDAVRSEVLVVREDGTTAAIEFHAIRRGDDIEVCFRLAEG